MDLVVQGKSCCNKPDGFTTKVSDGRSKLRSWLNKQMRIEMSDGRILLGIFLCSDRDGNVILGSCTEYINPDAWGFSDEPRMLGLVMVPGKHIIKVKHDADTSITNHSQRPSPTNTLTRINEKIISESNSCQKDTSVRPITGTEPIEWSQNPLWDPNLSDSPDSEVSKPLSPEDKTSANTLQKDSSNTHSVTTEITSAGSQQTTVHSKTHLANLYS